MRGGKCCLLNRLRRIAALRTRLQPRPKHVQAHARLRRPHGGGVAGGALRSVVECPFELVKTRRQVGNRWSLSQVYTGMVHMTSRNCLVVGMFWALVEGTKAWRKEMIHNSHGSAIAREWLGELQNCRCTQSTNFA